VGAGDSAVVIGVHEQRRGGVEAEEQIGHRVQQVDDEEYQALPIVNHNGCYTSRLT
jgi:hypothetical protein